MIVEEKIQNWLQMKREQVKRSNSCNAYLKWKHKCWGRGGQCNLFLLAIPGNTSAARKREQRKRGDSQAEEETDGGWTEGWAKISKVVADEKPRKVWAGKKREGRSICPSSFGFVCFKNEMFALKFDYVLSLTGESGSKVGAGETAAAEGRGEVSRMAHKSQR